MISQVFNLINKRFSFLVCVIFALFVLINCNDREFEFNESFYSMGTIVNLQLTAIDSVTAIQGLKIVKDEFSRLDEKYSTYKKGNYIGKINADSNNIVNVDEETYNLLKICKRVYRLTKGKFDPTLGYAIDNLGFKNDSTDNPDSLRIKRLVVNAGLDKVQLLEGFKIKKTPAIKFNFGGIVKGYAVDRAIGLLKQLNIKRALINAGGEIGCIGNNWKVGIQDPRNYDSLAFVLSLDNQFTATSGDYEQFKSAQEGKIIHILDPDVGIANYYNQSVTVICDSNVLADPLATGFMLMQPESILQTINGLPKYEVIIIARNGNKFYSESIIHKYKLSY
ncbi:MAG: FAD:protein FMN transferase [Ignavibacteria bacterium]|nr:MAG: FAD:protein FMN transferase [Ignavibacteria bacterium]